MDAEFRRLAHDLRYSNEVFVAKMAVSTPSQDEPEASYSEEYKFAKQLEPEGEALKVTLPRVYLFKHGDLVKPVVWGGDEKLSSLEVRGFIRAHIPEARVVLESCIPELDNIAEKFIAGVQSEGKAVLKKAEDFVGKLVDDVRKSGKVYMKIMDKVIERGELFLESKRQRVLNILNSAKVSDAKREQIRKRWNILASFFTTTLDTKAKNKL